MTITSPFGVLARSRVALGLGSIVLLSTLGVASPAAAQDRPYAPIVLRVPASTRYLAMGNASVASRDDDVVFYSPAQIAVARGLSVSAERYTATTRGGALSTVGRIGSGGVAFGASWLSYSSSSGGYPGSRADFARTGGSDGTSFLATLGVAQTYKRIQFGLAGKYVSDNHGLTREKGLLDVGVAKSLTIGIPVATALSVQNIGSDYSRDALITVPGGDDRTRLPMRAAVGMTTFVPVGLFDLGVASQVSVLRDGFVAPAGGVEVGFAWIDGYSVTARAGARRPEDGEGVATFGAGLQADRLTIDYALETLSGGAVAHRIGLRIR
jgi:hypothetical protein